MVRHLPAMLAAAVCLLLPVAVAAPVDADEAAELPAAKRTRLGLYMTAKEAYQAWKADPQGVMILDVRTPEEYVLVGHPAMARNIPWLLLKTAWSAAANGPVMVRNPDFLKQVKEHYRPHATLLVTCRSGIRSASAADVLAGAGFTKVYTITDGFEGEMVKDPQNVYQGLRKKNGWKNSGLPWTYALDPELMWEPPAK